MNNYFTNLTTAFVHDLDGTLNNGLGYKIPTYILNTGDELFMSDMTPIIDKDRTYYQRIPRCVIDVGGISTKVDELTMPSVGGRFKRKIAGQYRDFIADVRRLTVETKFSVTLYIENVLQYFDIVSVLLTNAFGSQAFRFKYLGYFVDCDYSIGETFDSERNTTLAHDSEERVRRLTFDVVVTSEFPAFKFAEAVSGDNRMNRIVWNGVLNNQTETHEINEDEETDYEPPEIGCGT